MTPTFSTLRLEMRGRVALATLARPPVNAINATMIEDIDKLADHVADTPEIKALVLVGDGANFAAGADIKAIEALPPGAMVEAFSRAGTQAFLKLENLKKPVVAAIRGFCLGGGNELAMACHLRFADAGAQFGQPEIKLGILPGFGATIRLPRLVGKSQAIRLLMTGETIKAEEALQLGLIQRIATGDVLDEALTFAETAASFSLITIEATLDAVAKESFDHESQLFGRVSNSRDMREGFRAFIGKRKATFTDS